MDATLASLSLLASRDDNASLGPKLIVFDDLERCLIDMMYMVIHARYRRFKTLLTVMV